jgi:hypothetical protein
LPAASSAAYAAAKNLKGIIMNLRRLTSGVAVTAFVAAAPLHAQVASRAAQPQPQAEHVEVDSELRGRGLLFGLVGASIVILLLLLLTDNGSDAEPQPGPPPVSP